MFVFYSMHNSIAVTLTYSLLFMLRVLLILVLRPRSFSLPSATHRNVKKNYYRNEKVRQTNTESESRKGHTHLELINYTTCL